MPHGPQIAIVIPSFPVYVIHPLEVGSVLSVAGYPDHVVAAGVLHDVLEDTDTDEAEVESRFGSRVAALVRVLSDDPSIPDEHARKAALRQQVAGGPVEAAAVFAADEVLKTRELRLKLSCGLERGAQAARKLDHYRASLAMLESVLGRHHLMSSNCASSSKRSTCFHPSRRREPHRRGETGP